MYVPEEGRYFNQTLLQTRVAIEMHSRANGAKRHAFEEACLAGHRALSEARGEARMLPLRSEFDQLLLACSKGVVYAMIA